MASTTTIVTPATSTSDGARATSTTTSATSPPTVASTSVDSGGRHIDHHHTPPTGATRFRFYVRITRTSGETKRRRPEAIGRCPDLRRCERPGLVLDGDQVTAGELDGQTRDATDGGGGDVGGFAS
jgi:hypothetical protein